MSIYRHIGERRVLTGLRRIGSTRHLLLGQPPASLGSATMDVRRLANSDRLGRLASV